MKRLGYDYTDYDVAYYLLYYDCLVFYVVAAVFQPYNTCSSTKYQNI